MVGQKNFHRACSHARAAPAAPRQRRPTPGERGGSLNTGAARWVSGHAGLCWGLAAATVTLAGLALRVLGLNKVDGFWYDEVLTFAVATESFPRGILQRLAVHDFNAPLYYFFLHVWIKLVGHNETLIRLSSVFPGVLSIPVFYLTGRDLGSRKAGLYAALLAAVNSCLIYFSQEVRFYALLALLTSLSAWGMVRIAKTGKAVPCLGLAAANLGVMYAYTMGVVYVALQFVVLGLWLFRGQRRVLVRLVAIQAAVSLLYLPYVPTLAHFLTKASRNIVGDFWWVTMGPASPLLVLQDWFSPILMNLRSHPSGYYRDLLGQGVDLFTLGLVVFPMALCVAGCVLTAMRKGPARLLLFNGLVFLVVNLALAYAGKISPMTRHTIIVLPFFIVAAAAGLAGMKHRWLSGGLLGLYVCLCGAYLLLGTASASRAPRDGYRKYIAAIERHAPTERDLVLMPYGSRSLGPYYADARARLAPFDLEAMYYDGIDLDRVFDAATRDALAYDPEKDKVLLRPYLAAARPAPPLEAFFRTQVVAALPPGGRLFLVVSGQVNPFSPSDLDQLTKREDAYGRVPLFLLLASKNINDFLSLGCRDLEPVTREDYPGWELYVLEKRAGSDGGRQGGGG